jgi:hydroxyacylglutathione hydrolase
MFDVNFSLERFYFHTPLQNWSYLIYWGDKALVVDPFAAAPLLEFLAAKKLKLTAILNTHEHFDHVAGNAELLKSFPAAFVIAPNHNLDRLKHLNLPPGLEVEAISTPGHCAQHLCFAFFKGPKLFALFSGDILFHGGVGRVMPGGNLEQLYQSLEILLMRVPGAASIYPGHDYLAKNLEFVGKLADFPKLPSQELDTMDNEKKRNPFLWIMNQRNWELLPIEWKLSSPMETFTKLRELRNRS